MTDCVESCKLNYEGLLKGVKLLQCATWCEKESADKFYKNCLESR